MKSLPVPNYYHLNYFHTFNISIVLLIGILETPDITKFLSNLYVAVKSISVPK